MHCPTPLRSPPDRSQTRVWSGEPYTSPNVPLISLLSGTGHKYKDQFAQSSPVFSNMLSSACVLFLIVSVGFTCCRNDSCDVSERGFDYRRTFMRQLTIFYIQSRVVTPSLPLPLKTFFPSGDFLFHFIPLYQTFGTTTSFNVTFYRKSLPLLSTLTLFQWSTHANC